MLGEIRTKLAALAMAGGMAFGLVGASTAHAVPANCPPNCDRIPDSAWIAPSAIPLYSTYRWPAPAAVAAPVADPRFRFEQACNTPPVADDARDFAVAARAVVPQPDGQWQLQVQVIHWRGETWRGGQFAAAVFDAAVASLRNCQLTAPLTSPSLTTATPTRVAAVVSGVLPGQPALHQYLLFNPDNSTLVELAMWTSGTATPQKTDWVPVPDAQVLDAMNAPLCTAYIDSCR